jgi:hypothetical protein
LQITMAMVKVESALEHFCTKEYSLATINIYCIMISKLLEKLRLLT